jgi:hypothetical protein
MEAAGEVAETIAGLCRASVIVVAGLGGGTGNCQDRPTAGLPNSGGSDQAVAVGRPGRFGLCVGDHQNAGGCGPARDSAVGGAAAGSVGGGGAARCR